MKSSKRVSLDASIKAKDSLATAHHLYDDLVALDLIEIMIGPLKARGARASLFGSRAKSTFKKFFDTDLVYDDSFQPITAADIYGLNAALEDSSFPFEVELVK